MTDEQLRIIANRVLYSSKKVHMGMDGEFIGVTEQMKRSDVRVLAEYLLQLLGYNQ